MLRLKMYCGAEPANEMLDEPRDLISLVMLRKDFFLLGGADESV